jgi:hypothetical protein
VEDVQVSEDTVTELLSVLARGHSKLPTLAWPKFNDSYRGYYVFKEELSAYIKDYGHGVGKRSLAEQIKKHYLSKGTADYLEFADSPEEILETLGGLFARPSRLIDSLMDPLRRHKKVPFDDWPALLAYLTKVRSMLKEVDRLGVFNLFNTVSNIDTITDKLPSDMVRKWMEHSKNLSDDQLRGAFEKFIAQEWRYATTVVSRTTSAKSALKAMGVGGGVASSGPSQLGGSRGSHQQTKRSDSRSPKTGSEFATAAQPEGNGAGKGAQHSFTAAGFINRDRRSLWRQAGESMLRMRRRG